MSSEELEFRKQIHDRPNDETVRLVFADWLDEHDRPDEAARQRKRADVFRGVRGLAAAVREYAAAQVPLWQQLPYWALQADGRTGWDSRYGNAYRYGCWSVGTGRKYDIVQVDLETGALGRFVTPYQYNYNASTWNQAPDTSVVDASELTDQLDAAYILDGLRKHVDEYRHPPSYYTGTDWEIAERRRQEILAQSHITPTSYRRKQ